MFSCQFVRLVHLRNWAGWIFAGRPKSLPAQWAHAGGFADDAAAADGVWDHRRAGRHAQVALPAQVGPPQAVRARSERFPGAKGGGRELGRAGRRERSRLKSRNCPELPRVRMKLTLNPDQGTECLHTA